MTRSTRCVWSYGMGAFLLAAGPMAAQEQETTVLEPIVVTANRVPLPYRVVSSRVTVITGEDLRSRGVFFVSEALSGIASAAVVQPGSRGAVASLFLRGGESDYVKVLVDGVAVNQPGGSYDFSALSTANVDRIEIVRGPVSVLYGSDAISGVIQVFTRNGARHNSHSLGFRAGTFGSRAGDAAVSGRTADVGYTLGITDYRSDGGYTRNATGRLFNNDFRATTLSADLTAFSLAGTRAAFTARIQDNKYSFPTDGSGNFVDENSFTAARAYTLGLAASRHIGEKLAVELLASTNRHRGDFNDAQDGIADTLGFFEFVSEDLIDRSGLDLRFDYSATGSTLLSLGAMVERQSIAATSRSNSQFGTGTSASDHSRNDRAVYAQALAELGSVLSVNGGLRFEDNENFGTHLTYRGGLVLHAGPGTRFRGSVGTGFKEPTFFESFATGFATGNPALEPEESMSAEVGFEQSLFGGRLVVEGAYYYQEFTNLIQYTFSPPNPTDPNYFNVAAATASGFELSTRLTPVTGLSFSADVALLDTEVTDAGFDAGDPDAAFAAGGRLLRRPNVSAAFRAEHAAPGRFLMLELRHTGDRVDRDFSTFPARRVTLSSRNVLNAAGRFGPVGGLPVALTVRVDNLLDQSYLQAVGFPALGRAVLAGAELEF